MSVRRIEARWIVAWLVSVVVALLVGFWGSWSFWREQWRLKPFEMPPPAKPCSLLTSNRTATGVWNELWAYSPGDDSRTEEVRFTREGELARLEVLRDGLYDDEVSATKETYWLVWLAPGGWNVSSCTSTVLR